MNIYKYTLTNRWKRLYDTKYQHLFGKYEINNNCITFNFPDSNNIVLFEFKNKKELLLTQYGHVTKYTAIKDASYNIKGIVNRVGSENDSLKLVNYTISVAKRDTFTNQNGYFIFNGLSEDIYEIEINNGEYDIFNKVIYLNKNTELNFSLQYSDYFPTAIGNRWEYNYLKEKNDVSDYINIHHKEFDGFRIWEILDIITIDKKNLN